LLQHCASLGGGFKGTYVPEPESMNLFLIYLFMSRHEVHSMNTHTLQNAG